MRNKFLRVVTVGALALSAAAPTFAACNPDTANCITDGGPGARLAKAKNQVFNPGTLGNCDCNSTLCGADIAGSSRKTTPTAKIGKVVVASAIR
jgi:hypothetical protein